MGFKMTKSTSLILRAFFRSDLTLLEGNWLPPQETESRLPWLEASIVERVLRTIRDANTILGRTHKDGFPNQQVPFRMA